MNIHCSRDVFIRYFGPTATSLPIYVVGNHDVKLGRSSILLFLVVFDLVMKSHSTCPTPIRLSTSAIIFSYCWIPLGWWKKTIDALAKIIDTSSKKKTGKVKAVWKPKKGGSVEFIKRVTQGRLYVLNEFTNTVTTVVRSFDAIASFAVDLFFFFHIPLARPERANCGPLREGIGPNPRIQRDAGSGYQNLLRKSTSTWLLEELKPQAIFSADNHDYYEFVHSYLPSSDLSADIHLGENAQAESDTMRIKETTVKEFSIAARIRRPGIQLLSLWNPSDGQHDVANRNVPTYADRPCLLPGQTRIYTHGYLLFALFTLTFLVWVDRKESRPKSKMDTPLLANSASFFDTPV
jgi:hypothetical protein